jgi:hypothetical protein
LERQYKLAIEARDKLLDNYHKWMSYYYLANAGVLVAITSVFTKDHTNPAILILSLIGLFICILWHFSCKGYYYWSKSWIDIIIRFERQMTLENNTLGVYSIFSKEVAEKEDTFWSPTKPANISTPKLTLLFSFLSIFSWSLFSGYQLHLNFPNVPICQIIIAFVTMFFLVYLLLPSLVKSRYDDSHTLVDCRRTINTRDSVPAVSLTEDSAA